MVRCMGVADDRGVFRMWRLPPGRYDLAIYVTHALADQAALLEHGLRSGDCEENVSPQAARAVTAALAPVTMREGTRELRPLRRVAVSIEDGDVSLGVIRLDTNQRNGSKYE